MIVHHNTHSWVRVQGDTWTVPRKSETDTISYVLYVDM